MKKLTLAICFLMTATFVNAQNSKQTPLENAQQTVAQVDKMVKLTEDKKRNLQTCM